jgi:hypothetical protein
MTRVPTGWRVLAERRSCRHSIHPHVALRGLIRSVVWDLVRKVRHRMESRTVVLAGSNERRSKVNLGQQGGVKVLSSCSQGA